MTCKRCGYILYGAENYCPHCGEKCRTQEIANEESGQAEPKPIFKAKESFDEENVSKDKIFSADVPIKIENETKKKTKKEKSGSKIAVGILSVLCVFLFGIAVFTTMDYFDIIPAVSDFLFFPEGSSDQNESTSESQFSSFFGIIEPEINYTPVSCIVSSSKGIALRKGPSDSFAQIDVLKSGSEVEVVGGSGQGEDWAYVYLPESDLYGWLRTAYIG